MSEQSKTESKDVKIGELLLAVNVVTSGDLQEAIQIAKRMKLPIGRVIVMSGVITEQNLQYALEAQSLIRDGMLELDTAIMALSNALKHNYSLQDALAELRWAPKKDVVSNKLGELLLDSNMVSQSQLDSALQTSFDTGMPLGGTLVLQGVLSAQLLPLVLNAQEQIRDGKVTRSQAVENLKAALMFWAKTDDAQNAELDLPKAIKDEPNVPSYTANPGSKRSSFTRPSEESLDMAPPPPPPPPPVANSGPSMGLVDMMKMAGYCSDAEIQAAIDRALASADIASKLFMATGLLTKESFENFVRCRALLGRGALKPEQAIYALSACRLRACPIDVIFKEMGLNLNGQ